MGVRARGWFSNKKTAEHSKLMLFVNARSTGIRQTQLYRVLCWNVTTIPAVRWDNAETRTNGLREEEGGREGGGLDALSRVPFRDYRLSEQSRIDFTREVVESRRAVERERDGPAGDRRENALATYT